MPAQAKGEKENRPEQAPVESKIKSISGVFGFAVWMPPYCLLFMYIFGKEAILPADKIKVDNGYRKEINAERNKNGG